MNLTKKTIIITWASDGIWKHIALKLAAQWSNLVLIARNQERLDAVKTECLTLWAPIVHTYICDISDGSQIEQTVKDIQKDIPQIDILINNAGIRQKLSPVEDISTETVGPKNKSAPSLHDYMMSYLAQTGQKSSSETAIINISSKSGVTAQAWQAVYTASKRWVRGFTEVLKTDLKDTNVRVAGIYQSGTNTQMFSKTTEDFPIQKFTDPADLADVVVFMLDRPAKIWLHEIHVAF